MGIEIERKFLVDKAKWQQLTKPTGVVMRQGYMLNQQSKTIRLRIANKQAFLTFKSGTAGISRQEYEYEIPIEDANQLFNQFVETGLEKTRYNITFDNKLWEVDVFEGENEGLIVAEIELDSEDEKFESPPWVAKEVSDDVRYYNSNLSVNPYKSW